MTEASERSVNARASASITLFSGLAVQAALDGGLVDRFTEETGVRVDITYEPTNVLLQEIANGARPDVMLGVAHQLDGLVASGVLDGESMVQLARTGVGIAAAPGVAIPDISTLESMTSALIAARSVAYSRTGASGVYFAALLERLGIAGRVNQHATILDKGFVAHALLDGRADLAVQQLSELRFVEGAVIVGPLPEGAQSFTDFAAASARVPAHRGAVTAFLDHLSGPDAMAAYARSGLDGPAPR